jgi:hypothetical protein
MPSKSTKTVYTVSDFLSWQRAKSLVLSPNFQRRSVWSASAKSYFIDTIARGLHVPIIFLREQTDLRTLESIREVVDGQQGLRTIIAYIDYSLLSDYKAEWDAFEIRRLHNPELAGKPFDKLPADMKRRILNYELSVHVLPSDTDDREVLQIFARMNSTGMKLNHQELRNAAYYGAFKQFNYKLAYEYLYSWRKWKIFSEVEIARMVEVEETGELVLLIMNGIKNKSQNALTNTYGNYDDDFPAVEEVANRFRAVMDTIELTLGEKIKETVFSRKTLFYTLFSFYYDYMY